MLKNQRHELFAQHWAEGKTELEAHTLAGYKPDAANANRLTKNDKIIARVEEIQDERRKASNVTVAAMTARFNDAIVKAGKDGSHPAVMAGLNNLAKLHGLIVDKSHVEVSELEKMSDEQLRAAIARKVPKLRVVGTGQDGRGTGEAPGKKQAG